MKITLGEWKTRSGRKAIVAGVTDDASIKEPYRVIGWLNGKGRAWTSSGVATPGFEDDDLIAPWSDPVPWDWSTTPPWINWIAMDSNGYWYMYDSEPGVEEKGWSFTVMFAYRIPKSHCPKWSGDLKLSKTMRPKGVAN